MKAGVKVRWEGWKEEGWYRIVNMQEPRRQEEIREWVE